MKITRLRIKRCMRDEDAAAWARALVEPVWWGGAVVLKDEPGSSWVRRATINGRAVVVKCRYLNRRSRRIKSMLGYGHGDKYWRGAALLASKKIATARPIVLGTARLDGELVELLVLNYLSGPTLLEVMDQVRRGVGPGVREQHRIAEAVGRSVGAMLTASLWNRDHKPSNLIVRCAVDDESTIAVIDVVGVRRLGPEALRVDGLECEEMWAALMIESIGVGCPPRRTLWMRAVRSWMEGVSQPLDREMRHLAIRTTLIEGAGGIVEMHGDPRPAVHPLAHAHTSDVTPVEPVHRT